ncbi:hypothetical protein [Vibrio mexicanus]|uniref:hypothetical protein n=1 Tax=Vibrio mexicanus TaxID=1004326 RepID=UPI00063C6988|nr:hypothetical protein [Vibrio mexicanus]
MRILLGIGVGLLVTFSTLANIDELIAREGVAEVFIESLQHQYAIGPNFNHTEYVFSYPCGGGAICGAIYSKESTQLIHFPTEFQIDSEMIAYETSYSLGSNEICFSGQSAYDSTVYDNVCFALQDGVLKRITPHNINSDTYVLTNDRIHKVPSDEIWVSKDVPIAQCKVCTADVYVESGIVEVDGMTVEGKFNLALRKSETLVFHSGTEFVLGDVRPLLDIKVVIQPSNNE